MEKGSKYSRKNELSRTAMHTSMKKSKKKKKARSYSASPERQHDDFDGEMGRHERKSSQKKHSKELKRSSRKHASPEIYSRHSSLKRHHELSKSAIHQKRRRKSRHDSTSHIHSSDSEVTLDAVTEVSPYERTSPDSIHPTSQRKSNEASKTMIKHGERNEDEHAAKRRGEEPDSTRAAASGTAVNKESYNNTQHELRSAEECKPYPYPTDNNTRMKQPLDDTSEGLTVYPPSHVENVDLLYKRKRNPDAAVDEEEGARHKTIARCDSSVKSRKESFQQNLYSCNDASIDNRSSLSLEIAVNNLEKQRRDRLEKFKAMAATTSTESRSNVPDSAAEAPKLSAIGSNEASDGDRIIGKYASSSAASEAPSTIGKNAMIEATTADVSSKPKVTLSGNKNDRLNRFHAFAALKLTKSIVKPADSDEAMTVEESQKTKAEQASSGALHSKMKLKLAGNTSVVPSSFTSRLIKDKEGTSGALKGTESSSARRTTSRDTMSSLIESSMDDMDSLDAYMKVVRSEMNSDLQKAEEANRTDFAIDLPKEITLEEIQGWNQCHGVLDEMDYRSLKLATAADSSTISEDTVGTSIVTPSTSSTGLDRSESSNTHGSLDYTISMNTDSNQIKSNEIDDDDDDAYYKLFLEQMKQRSADHLDNISVEQAEDGKKPLEGKAHNIAAFGKNGVISDSSMDGKTEDFNISSISNDRLVSFASTTTNEKMVSGNANVSTDNERNEIDVAEERLFSDDEAPIQSELENNTETYFDLVKKVGQKKELPPVDHSAIAYVKFRKNLYIQVRELSLMKDHEVEALRKTHGNIKVRGKSCPRPITSFFQCGLPDKVVKLIQKREYTEPFPIQMQAIPALMSGRDVIGIAETGSGKTLAYVLPLLRHVLDQAPLRDRDGPIALVIAPTRELALQIYHETSKFCKVISLRHVAIYGGTGIGEQLGMLRRGAEVVVGTPGRLIDVLTISNGKVTNLQRTSFLVLDEADRMFDMGFEPQISAIIRNIQPGSQRCLFSATFPPHIEALARKILYKPIEIIVGEKGRSASQIRQYVEVRTEQDKFYRLLQLLGEWNEHGSIVIFVSRQIEADELFGELFKYGYQCAVLHGGQDQADREFTLQDFKEGVKTILIATSIAARGLDVKSIVLVINYKPPSHLEDYVHRIGRTGRAGNVGVAYSFITPNESDKAEDFVKALRQSNQPIPAELQQLADHFKTQCNLRLAVAHKNKGFGGRGFKFTMNEKSRLQVERQAAKKELGMDEEEDEITGSSTDADAYSEELSAPVNSNAMNVSNVGLAYGTQPGAASTGSDLTLIPVASSTSVASMPGLGNTAGIDTVSVAAARAKALADMLRRQDSEKLVGNVQPPPPPTPPPVYPGGAAPGESSNISLAQGASIEDQATDMARNIVSHIQDPHQREIQFRQTKQSIKESLLKMKGGLPRAQAAATNASTDHGADTLKQGIGAGSVLTNQMFTKQYGKYPGLQGDAGVNASLLPGGQSPIFPTLGKIPGLSSQAFIDPNTGNYVDELDINDYPQQARFKITHKEVLSQISEETSAVCQIKGQYVPPEQTRILLPGVKRLYVEIVGGTQVSVQRAKHELRMLMESASLRQLNVSASQRPVGRYSVI